MSRPQKLAILATLAGIMLFMAPPVLGQSQSGHVYTIRYHQVHQGQNQAYNTAYAEITRPLLDEVKKRGAIVSYLDLVQFSGAGKTSHLLIIEYPNWAALDAINQKLEEGSQAVWGKSFGEAVGNLPNIRDYLRTETYTSPVP